jgi:hypothetical protein
MLGHGCDPDFGWVPDLGVEGGALVDGVVMVGVVVVWVVDGVVLVDEVVVDVDEPVVVPALEPVDAEAPAIPAAAPPLASAPATIVAPSIFETFIFGRSSWVVMCVGPESGTGFRVHCKRAGDP